MKTKLICITGMDGSGKSTLIKLLMEKQAGIIPSSVYDLLILPELRGNPPVVIGKGIDEYLSIMHPEGRFLFLLHAYYEGLMYRMSQNPPYIIADGYWYKYFATEAAMGGNIPYMQNVAAIFPAPDMIFYLQVPDEIATERKGKFTGYECGYADVRNENSFMELRKKSVPHLEKLLEKKPHITLNGCSSPGENAEIVLGMIEQLMKVYQVED